jgi:glycosyltransferase involved in cell wall biosynthesis
VRIAFLTNTWAFQLPGGGEQVLLQSRRELERRGHTVALFDPWRDKLRDFDVIHYFHCPGWDCWTRLKTYGPPLVVTPTLWCEPPSRRWIVREVRHAAHRLADGWWCPPIDERAVRHHLMIPDLLLPASRAEAGRLNRFAGIPLSRMRVVRNVVSVDSGDEQVPADLDEALGDGSRLLCVGSFHREKNQLTLIRALRGLPDRVVFIGGCYPDDPGYLHECRAEAGGQHWFFPEQRHSVVLSAMRRVRLYVQPSLRETCGLAALEAAALGCRVAITRRGGAREYFGDYAWYFDPERPSDIRRTLAAAASARWNGALATHVLARHGHGRLGDDLETAYHSLEAAA